MQNPTRIGRQDTFDLRGDIQTGGRGQQHDTMQYTSDEDRSVMDDDSEEEENDGEYLDDDDGASSLSIPNEVIDFDLVYSLHTFVATVDGQANVIKGDRLVLMDDSNSYWWLVRVLKTQQIGYIPAENIETPFERLARLNKHRNVDLAGPTQAEVHEDVRATRERLRLALARQNGVTPPPHQTKSVIFTGSSVYNYPPAVWGDEVPEDDDWDEEEEEYESFEGEDGEQVQGVDEMEPDDGMSWDHGVAEQAQSQRVDPGPAQATGGIPSALLAGGRPPVSGQRPGQATQPQSQPQQAAAAQQQQQQIGPQAGSAIRQQTSRERLTSQVAGQVISPNGSAALTSTQQSRYDPAEATETRRVTATPPVAQDTSPISPKPSPGPLLPSTILQQQQQQSIRRTVSASSSVSGNGSVESNGKRSREDVNDIDTNDAKKSKGKDKGGDRKLKKGRASEDTDDGGITDRGADSDREKKKKSGGILGGLFGGRGKKKDKDEKKLVGISSDSYERGSEDSNGRLSSQNQKGGAAAPTLRIDQEQQARYQQQYLQRPTGAVTSPSNLAVNPLLANQTLSASPPSSAQISTTMSTRINNRPGSLILSPAMDGGTAVPELSVLRVFAGENLQSEATFKTVLLNSSTTSADLVRQAMQRFRLAHAEDEKDYFLTVKQLQGDEAVLTSDENPLKVFEELVERAMSIPTVKRSSVGSISSVSSNLSTHPAIAKLGMNDFTDDSTVKFYLNRRSNYPQSPRESGALYKDALEDLEPDTGNSGDREVSNSNATPKTTPSVSTAGADSVSPERFSSPTARFALQIVIFPEDLPDGVVFDPHTEAIVPRSTLQSRSVSSAGPSPGVSQNVRKKIFIFPRNTTVAEVIEASLERFGIIEGVVDGGDEVEDKLAKRRSSSRVRYGLTVDIPGEKERELAPSSKVLEAFPRPPLFRIVERRSADMRRRSTDSTQLLGTVDDLQPDDPVFVLRRAVGLRLPGSHKQHRMSAPLDEIAMQQLQRDLSTSNSESGDTDDKAAAAPSQAMSRRELIAAQRVASRANQAAMLTAQANSERGVDVLLPDRGRLRSVRSAGDERIRYSYIQPDGETYDISDIIEEEWSDDSRLSRIKDDPADSWDDDDDAAVKAIADANPDVEGKKGEDLLGGVLAKPRDVMQKSIDRVLTKIKDGRGNGKIAAQPQPSEARPEDSPSVYSFGEATASRAASPNAGSRSATPLAGSRAPSRSQSARAVGPSHHPQASIASIMSDVSVDAPRSGTPGGGARSKTPTGPSLLNGTMSAPLRPMKPTIQIREDFGLEQMISIIELAAARDKPPPRAPLSFEDEVLFGPCISASELHPRVRDIFEPTLQKLDDMDKQLDELLKMTFRE